MKIEERPKVKRRRDTGEGMRKMGWKKRGREEKRREEEREEKRRGTRREEWLGALGGVDAVTQASCNPSQPSVAKYG